MIFAGDQKDKPPLYLPSKNWEPDPSQVPPELRIRIKTFLRSIRKLFPKRHGFANLLPIQTAAFKYLKTSSDLIVLKSDKNLGPVVMDRTKYLHHAYVDHLDDQSTYRELTESQAITRVKTIKKILFRFLDRYFPILDKKVHPDRIYLERAYKQANDDAQQKQCLPISTFYLLAKIHKHPLKTRPIVSVSGSILFGLGKWVDYILQDLIKQYPTYFPFYIQSSTELVQQLKHLDLPRNCSIFTADAVSMYTNIETTHALTMFKTFFESFSKHAIHDGLLPALEIIMRHCVFTFDDKFWVQLSGTAMGAPPAPMYATIYFAIHEQNIIPEYNQNLIFYRRFIDDTIGIWYDASTNSSLHFKQLQADFDNYGKLKWTFSTLSNHANFLDVSISIQDQRIHYSMHEKALNLYLYLPPHLCHPPGVLKGLIHGRLHMIANFCSDQEDKTRLH